MCPGLCTQPDTIVAYQACGKLEQMVFSHLCKRLLAARVVLHLVMCHCRQLVLGAALLASAMILLACLRPLPRLALSQQVCLHDALM
jgi:hypothetical protein